MKSLPGVAIRLLALGASMGVVLVLVSGCGGAPCDQKAMNEEFTRGELATSMISEAPILFGDRSDLESAPKELIGCADLDGDGSQEMVVQASGPTAGSIRPWAILGQRDGDWRVELLRAGTASPDLVLRDGAVIETSPSFFPGDPTCCPTGRDRKGRITGEDGRYSYVPLREPLATGKVGFRGTSPTTLDTLAVEQASPVDALIDFGDPSFVSIDEPVCEISWGDLGLQMMFVNFGGSNPCGPSGRVGSFGLSGQEAEDAGWKTQAGLSVGDPESAMRRAYPAARAAQPYGSFNESYFGGDEGEVFLLAEKQSLIGSGGTTPTVLALVNEGKVKGLEFLIGAGGD